MSKSRRSGSVPGPKGRGAPETSEARRDEGDQELIKQQRAEQTKRGDGKIQPMTEQERQPEPKR